MSGKRYDEFSAGTYDPTKIFLQGDPGTGALEKVFLPSIDSLLPSQSGNSGKFLTTNGSAASWAAFSAWSLTGNAGTTAGTNFLGTTDNIDFIIKRNSVTRLQALNAGIVINGQSGVDSVAALVINRGDVTSRSISFRPSDDGGTKNTIAFTLPALFTGASSYTFSNNVVANLFGQSLLYNGTFSDPATGIYAAIKVSDDCAANTSSGISHAGFTATVHGTCTINNNTYAGIYNNTSVVSGTGIKYGIYVGSGASYSQFDSKIAIGTPAVTTAIFEIVSTTRGSKPAPDMTTTQKNAITSPGNGLMVFDTTLGKYCFYSSATAAWETITSV